MKRLPCSWLRQVAAFLLIAALQTGAGTSVALAQSGEAKGDVLRPEIGKPLQAAQEFLNAQNYKDALTRVRKAEAVPGPTPFEKFSIDRLRRAAAFGSGDTAGQSEKGLGLMEQGVKKGGLRRPEDAKLHLAIAYLAAGQKAKAIDAFKSVQGADGTADLARLWLIHVQRASS